MNRSNRLKNKNSRRFSFSNILAKEVLLERMEERIVPAYVSGDFGWASTFETGNISIENAVRSSVVDSNENVYQVGAFSGSVDFDPGVPTSSVSSKGGPDAFIVKLDSKGFLVWIRTFGSIGSDKATSVTLDLNGNPVITGSFQGTVDFDPGTGVLNQTTSGADDAFIINLDTTGGLQWVKTIGGTSSDQGKTLTTDNFGNILIAGMYYGTVDFDPGPNVVSMTSTSGSTDIFFLKLDKTGNLL